MEPALEFMQSNSLSVFSLVWFLLCFKGYMFYAGLKSRGHASLAGMMHHHRTRWMLKMLDREVRIADTTILANLERSVSFFASTSILILAGLVTVLGSTEQAIDVVGDIPFSMPATRQEWEFKLLVMIALFIYAFFKFTWSIRQYGFVSVMLGGAPGSDEGLSEAQKQDYASRMAKMSSKAANNFNFGLRSYYFSLAVLGWFISPWIFMILSSGVVIVLYRREFNSATLEVLTVDANMTRSS
ncbi:MAG: DUF599 domain-containing protein [Pontibacterium sp.]